jgi:predicted nucleic acid-binding protein
MRVVVTDTSVLINFAWIGRLDLDEAIHSGWLLPVETTLREQEVLGRLLQEDRLDPGEAECLAIAAARGCFLGCDERSRKFLRVKRRLLGDGRCVSSLDLVVSCLSRGLLDLAEADHFLEVWRRNRFQPGINSFAERWKPDGGADRVAETVRYAA